jgi:hypothetical protein
MGKNKKKELILLLAAIAVLAAGALVYVFDRRPEHVYFLPQYLSLADASGQLLGRLGAHLPTFAHVYAFILLTRVVLGSGTRVLPICLFWFGMDALFEFAQSTAAAAWISQVLATRFDGIPVLENSAAYFQAGKFDWLDILSIAIGTILAWATVSLSNHKESDHVIHYKSTGSMV